MDAKRFFRQDIVRWPLLDWDDYSGSTYEEPETIKARWADVERAIRSAAGVEIVSDTVVSTLARLQEGDLLFSPEGTQRTVVRVREARDVDGVVSHYVGVVR